MKSRVPLRCTRATWRHEVAREKRAARIPGVFIPAPQRSNRFMPGMERESAGPVRGALR